MRKLLTLANGFVFSFVLCAAAGTEIVCALGPGAASYNPASDQRPTADAMEMATSLSTAMSSLCAPKCPEIPLFRNPTAANVMLVFGTGGAKVVYAPAFFQSLYDNYGEGALIGVIAHEYGHALDEIYPQKFGSGGTPELRADAWAGCALAKNNPTPARLASALTGISKYPTPGNPPWEIRLSAFKLGYTKCAGDSSRIH
jgi:hypothetical protein